MLDAFKRRGLIPYHVEYLSEREDPRREIKERVQAWEERTGRSLLPEGWQE